MTTTGYMTSLGSVTVFTKDIAGGFIANTIRSTAFAKTEEQAVKRAAAHFFSVPEDKVEAIRDGIPHVWTGRLQDQELVAKSLDPLWLKILHALCVGIIVAALAAIVIGVLGMLGGAR